MYVCMYVWISLMCTKIFANASTIPSSNTSFDNDPYNPLLSLCHQQMIYFDPVDETQNKLELLRKAIPEFYECKHNTGG